MFALKTNKHTHAHAHMDTSTHCRRSSCRTLFAPVSLTTKCAHAHTHTCAVQSTRARAALRRVDIIYIYYIETGAATAASGDASWPFCLRTLRMQTPMCVCEHRRGREEGSAIEFCTTINSANAAKHWEPNFPQKPAMSDAAATHAHTHTRTSTTPQSPSPPRKATMCQTKASHPTGKQAALLANK